MSRRCWSAVSTTAISSSRGRRVWQDVDRRAPDRRPAGRGPRVGVTGPSHRAIHNLLDEVERVASDERVEFRGLKKAGKGDESIYTGRFIDSTAPTLKVETPTCSCWPALRGSSPAKVCVASWTRFHRRGRAGSVGRRTGRLAVGAQPGAARRSAAVVARVTGCPRVRVRRVGACAPARGQQRRWRCHGVFLERDLAHARRRLRFCLADVLRRPTAFRGRLLVVSASTAMGCLERACAIFPSNIRATRSDRTKRPSGLRSKWIRCCATARSRTARA